jgi:hypothetical protein
VRKPGAILFLAVLLFNGSGFYVYYAIQLWEIKQEMREALRSAPEGQLEIFVLTEQQFRNSLVDEYEVQVNDKMYDIARTVKHGNLIKVYCLHDQQEDDLLDMLSEIIGKPLKNKTAIPQQVAKFLALTYILPQADLFVLSKQVANLLNFHYLFSIVSFISLQDSPPPWA